MRNQRTVKLDSHLDSAGYEEMVNWSALLNSDFARLGLSEQDVVRMLNSGELVANLGSNPLLFSLGGLPLVSIESTSAFVGKWTKTTICCKMLASKCACCGKLFPLGDGDEENTRRNVEGSTFEDLLNRAAGELPGGFVINVSVESGAAWVILNDPDGEDHDVPTIDESLEATFLDAIQKAREMACDDCCPKIMNHAKENGLVPTK